MELSSSCLVLDASTHYSHSTCHSTRSTYPGPEAAAPNEKALEPPTVSAGLANPENPANKGLLAVVGGAVVSAGLGSVLGGAVERQHFRHY